VQRVPVRIVLDDDGAELGKLRPGLSVVVQVDERRKTGDRVNERHGPLFVTMGAVLFTPIMNQWGFEEMLLPLAFRGIGVPFAMALMVTLTMGNLPPDRLKSASGLFALMRNLGGAIGIAVSATVVNDRTNLHFLRIAEHLNFSNTELAGWLHRMASRYTEAWDDPTAGQVAALKKLWGAAYREAQVQAFADAYFLIAVCFVVSAMMVPLMRVRWPCSLIALSTQVVRWGCPLANTCPLQASPATCCASVARYRQAREKRSVRGEPAGYELSEEPHALRLACLPLREKPERSIHVQVGARHPHQ
jgi:hypothetical protein